MSRRDSLSGSHSNSEQTEKTKEEDLQVPAKYIMLRMHLSKMATSFFIRRKINISFNKTIFILRRQVMIGSD